LSNYSVSTNQLIKQSISLQNMATNWRWRTTDAENYKQKKHKNKDNNTIRLQVSFKSTFLRIQTG